MANINMTDINAVTGRSLRTAEVECGSLDCGMSMIEHIAPFTAGKVRFAVFDFDGTLSLIREGWQQIMIPMMVEILQATGTSEDVDALTELVRLYVTDLTGKQTIYQMIRLQEEVQKRGGQAEEPLVYKNMYHDRLMQQIIHRLDGLRNGTIAPAEYVVPGTFEILALMRKHGVRCYLASGTDEKYVLDEAALLGIDGYFEKLYGAQDDYKNFSKRKVIRQIIAENNLHGEEVVAFGDGFVEIEEMKAVGGLAVGLATDEAARTGVDAWKRSRLIAAGADLILPDFRGWQDLEPLLFAEKEG
jgi:phosphoglycolate phosphatase-like HAD superfamily hydrolase